MRIIFHRCRRLLLTFALLAGGFVSTRAQEVIIPDPGLNAAIRDALQITNGPLMSADLLSLTNLDARSRNVVSIEGLEAARNLVSLDLQINQLTNFSLPAGLTKLTSLDVSINPLTNCFLPAGLTNLASLTLEGDGLASLTLPSGLIRLSNLDLENNQLTSFNQLSNLTSLVALDLGFNSFTNFTFPGGLTNLATVYFAGNPLTNLTLLPGLASLTELNLSQNLLTSFTLPAGMTNLGELDLGFNQLTNLNLSSDLGNLTELDLDFNRLAVLNFPPGLTGLRSLHLRANQFTNFSLPVELAGLTYLDVSENPVSNIILPAGLGHLVTLRIAGNTNLASLILPVGLTNLTGLNLGGNILTNLVLPPDLGRLESLNLGGNRLASLTLPAGLTNLAGFFVTGNQLTTLTLPPDMTGVIGFGYAGNPLASLVLSEPAATNLAGDVAFLRGQGIPVFTYPLAAQLVRPQMFSGAFKLAIIGPPGTYTIFDSADLVAWSVLDVRANPLGSVNYTDTTVQFSPRKFYRTLLQSPPSNMVFIAPNTFVLGTPANEAGRQADEGPPTTVTITHGFWMGKYEVTQREYLAVIGSNPSGFPGDLDRPVESVSWLDATNYCAKLTEQELAAGHISPGSQYRLPTEAEWECAARAGTATRFSYGEDPNVTSLINYGWYAANSGFGTHRVGQKIPNAWGLYDMEGNVFEWCQDWYGPFPGGSVTNPQGPPSNLQGVKVIRGGSWDSGEADCRSGRRLTEGVSPFITDFILGFRVVLVTSP